MSVLISKPSEHGLTLIEVLVSLAILSIGLLGLAGLEARTLEKVQSSYFKDIAADLTTDLADRIRANKTPWMIEDSSTEITFPLAPDYAEVKNNCTLALGSYTCPSPGTVHNATTTGNAVAMQDMSDWLNSVITLLPNGSATITSTSIQNGRAWRYLITLNWTGSRGLSTVLANDNTLTTVVE